MPKKEGIHRRRIKKGTGFRTVSAGHVDHLEISLKRDSFQESCLKLLKTMRDPSPKKAALRRAARQKLDEKIAWREERLKEYREKLCRGRTKPEQFSKDELIELNTMGIKKARLDIIKALRSGAKETSKEMEILLKRVKKLEEQRRELKRT